ncbi:unnamed protein product [Larinioides sclopetarius]|uniref:Uncharacterized protein n=1 Tax=Larinioides sclopetarius TaxID=280406 RepID=A0AAV1ZZ07_9ARAC
MRHLAKFWQSFGDGENGRVWRKTECSKLHEESDESTSGGDEHSLASVTSGGLQNKPYNVAVLVTDISVKSCSNVEGGHHDLSDELLPARGWKSTLGYAKSTLGYAKGGVARCPHSDDWMYLVFQNVATWAARNVGYFAGTTVPGRCCRGGRLLNFLVCH